MSDFTFAVLHVLKHEGGLSENPNDPGGITNFGISLRFLKSIDAETLKKYNIYDTVTDDTIRTLTLDQAKKIYYGEFWNHAPFQEILAQDLCNYIFDMACNMGIAPAVRAVQRATWAVMKKWELLKDDGILGDKTLAAIEKCGFLLMPALRAERGNYYRAICNRNPQQKEFLEGWYDRTYHN